MAVSATAILTRDDYEAIMAIPKTMSYGTKLLDALCGPPVLGLARPISDDMRQMCDDLGIEEREERMRLVVESIAGSDSWLREMMDDSKSHGADAFALLFYDQANDGMQRKTFKERELYRYVDKAWRSNA